MPMLLLVDDDEAFRSLLAPPSATRVTGILLGAWLGTRLGLAVAPAGIRWPHLAGAATLGGIGFTVSLFIAGLALSDPLLADAARLAIFSASAIAAALGAGLLLATKQHPPTD